jgi:hypothetical protein
MDELAKKRTEFVAEYFKNIAAFFCRKSEKFTAGNPV